MESMEKIQPKVEKKYTKEELDEIEKKQEDLYGTVEKQGEFSELARAYIRHERNIEYSNEMKETINKFYTQLKKIPPGHGLAYLIKSYSNNWGNLASIIENHKDIKEDLEKYGVDLSILENSIKLAQEKDFELTVSLKEGFECETIGDEPMDDYRDNFRTRRITLKGIGEFEGAYYTHYGYFKEM
ncbi:MAG: hypothetical protein NTZ97_00105 [Candidatus Moranbacteria bacterium]|nr:hypothetical protein [Candidatus Moranbacteria bacterium]